MPSIKERVEQNVVVWLLATLFTGFTTGVGAYRAGLQAIGQVPISTERLARLERSVGVAQTQRWIRLTEVEFDGAVHATRYRVVIKADGIPYSYPGHALWKEVGPTLVGQAFPLPADVADHSVEFQLLYETRESEARLAQACEPLGFRPSIAQAQIDGALAIAQTSSVPVTERDGEVPVFDVSGGTRSANRVATIHYRMSDAR